MVVNIGLVLLAAMLVFLPKVKRIPQYVGTLFHEVGHVLASYVTGGGASRIILRADTSGVAGTSHQIGAGGALSRIITLLSGYATPLNFGAILITLSFTDWYMAGMIIVGVFSFIALLLTRNLFGALITVLFAGLTAILIFLPLPITQPQALLLIGSILFLNGLQDILRIAPHAFKRGLPEDQHSDFHILESTFRIPSPIWFILFCVVEFSFFVAGIVIILLPNR